MTYDWHDLITSACLGFLLALPLCAYAYRQYRPIQPRCPKCQAWCSPKKRHVCRHVR